MTSSHLKSLVESTLPSDRKPDTPPRNRRHQRGTSEEHAPSPLPDGSTAEEKALLFTYDVVRYRGHWRILHIGRYTGTYSTAEVALVAAVKIARKKLEAGHSSVVRLHRTDGRIVDHAVGSAPGPGDPGDAEWKEADLAGSV